MDLLEIGGIDWHDMQLLHVTNKFDIEWGYKKQIAGWGCSGEMRDYWIAA
jgi:hypothetical protein